jgi:DNA repair protein RadC
LLVALFLTRSHRLKHSFAIRGDRSSAMLPRHRIVRAIGRTHAVFVVLAHNHPSGLCRPSDADRRVTSELSQVCRMIGACLVDHIIFAGDEYVSFKREGWL